MISLQNIHKSYGDLMIYQGLNMDIPTGDLLCIVGGSGMGKSVLTRLILGLETPDEGEIVIDNQQLTKLDAVGKRNLLDDFGVVFQGAALFDSMTIRENVGIKLDEELNPEEEVQQEVQEALAAVDLGPEVLDKYPAELSGGMRKRVGIARAIIHRPRYLVYDEPTTGLDPINSALIDQLILKLNREESRTSIVVTHDLESVKILARHVLMIGGGEVLFRGTKEAFFESESVHIQAFIARGK
ncbi:MAG: ATP-binding cassette domain-containing protein [Bacteroidota bacterium]